MPKIEFVVILTLDSPPSRNMRNQSLLFKRHLILQYCDTVAQNRVVDTIVSSLSLEKHKRKGNKRPLDEIT